MIVNGVEKSWTEKLTVAAFLEQEHYKLSYLAVERNGKLVPKAAYKTVLLKPEDRLEIVSFVGGG